MKLFKYSGDGLLEERTQHSDWLAHCLEKLFCYLKQAGLSTDLL